MTYRLELIEHLTHGVYLNIYPLLKRGLEHTNDGATVQSIIVDIQQKSKHLWLIYKQNEIIGITITSFVEYPHCKRLLYYLVVGDNFKSWVKFHENINQWAKGFDCDEVEIFGRKGWLRVLKKMNYELEYIAMTRKI